MTKYMYSTDNMTNVNVYILRYIYVWMQKISSACGKSRSNVFNPSLMML